MSATPSKYKCFSLIYGNTVHIAPESKVIAAEEISAIMDGRELVEAIKNEAENYRIEVTKDCAQIEEQAEQKGFAAGFAAWSEQIAHAEEQLKRAKKELEKVLAVAAMKAAKKIVGREIELSEETIVDIVANSLKTVAQHKKVTIYVNRKSKEILEKQRPRLKELFEQLELLSIQEREDVTAGGCIIETEKGIINARIESQWDVLENAFRDFFRDLMKK